MNTKIEKVFEIEKPIEQVWAVFSNPQEIVTCVPGAAVTEKIDDKNYKGEVVTKFGPIKAKYSGEIEILELDNVAHKMVFKGRGLDSKGKGSADMIMHSNITEENGKTKVSLNMDVTIVGMLAQFGSRLINDVSQELLNQMVTNLHTKLDGENVDNSLKTGAMLGTVAKSIFGFGKSKEKEAKPETVAQQEPVATEPTPAEPAAVEPVVQTEPVASEPIASVEPEVPADPITAAEPTVSAEPVIPSEPEIQIDVDVEIPKEADVNDVLNQDTDSH